MMRSPILVLAVLAGGLSLAACGTPQRSNTLEAPRTTTPTQSLAATITPPPARSQFSLSTYRRAPDFKALASVNNRTFGAADSEGSLVAAEREALKQCAQNSQYEGDCDIVQIGDQGIAGLGEDSEQRIRWRYLRGIHQSLAVRRPVKLRLPIKVLQPGSKVVDGNLYLSGDFTEGGYSVVRFDGVNCTGNLDPIEREPDAQRPASRDLPIGIMEYACDGGEVLRGGYVRVDSGNQIFFLEDKRGERWDFIASTRNSRIGSDVTAFKSIYKEIERSE